MAILNRLAEGSGQQAAEMLIIGGGIMGLWAAFYAARRGQNVLLVEKNSLAKGASGGLLGSLMAHTPDRWNGKKQFQFEALVALPKLIAGLEEETGLNAGYRRCGRLIPLHKPGFKQKAQAHYQDSLNVWRMGEGEQLERFTWSVLDQSPFGPDWPNLAAIRPDGDADFAGEGVIFDELAARVNVRQLTAMLIASLKAHKNVAIIEGVGLVALNADKRFVQLENGDIVHFGAVIIAAGTDAFAMLSSVETARKCDAASMPKKPLGMAVKGQAAMLAADIGADLPMIYHDGLYIVPHDHGRVAIGSTSETRFDQPFSTDDQLEQLIDRARDLAPALKNADVVERWAGLRPRAIGNDPMVGPHPAYAHVIALAGGYKVSFGIAHHLAEIAVNFAALAQGEKPNLAQNDAKNLPESFFLSRHLSIFHA